MVNESPGEYTVAAIGPLTNIALAFKSDPSLPDLINEMFIMGGNFEGIGNSTIAAGVFNCLPPANYF